MASLQAVGNSPKVSTITERLINARGQLRNAHGRLYQSASRAGLLTPTPSKDQTAAPECSDLNGVVQDIEHLCEMLVQDCSEVEKIA